ncbi:MAG: protease modulator HflK, partial [Verrucomicrobiota bacterium]
MNNRHDPPRDHDHDHRQVQGAPVATAPSRPGTEGEDAGSQALSDALRSSFFIVKILMVLLVVVFLGSGVFTVPSQERAIVLRFGKPVGVGEKQLLGPGLHFAFPAPIDEVVRIKISEVQKITSTVAWHMTPELEMAGQEADLLPSLDPAVTDYALTGDGNIIHTEATLRYRINDPLAFELNFVSASNVVQNALNNAVLHAAARFNVDDALRLNVLGFQEKIASRLREIVAQQKLGITIEQVDVRSLPPQFVKQAFKEVLDTEVNRRATNDLAQAYANNILNTAQGEATNLLNAGQTDRTRLLQSVQSEAEYFQNQLP